MILRQQIEIRATNFARSKNSENSVIIRALMRLLFSVRLAYSERTFLRHGRFFEFPFLLRYKILNALIPCQQ